jgi:hypothetical protein
MTHSIVALAQCANVAIRNAENVPIRNRPMNGSIINRQSSMDG